MTPAQCRAARAFLGWSQVALAEKAGVSVSFIIRFEQEKRVRSPAIAREIAHHFDAAGIEFDDDGGVHPRIEVTQ